jgi:tetratricopeptide (TPR) repeat protein/CHAT domain-containing protein
MASEQSEQQIRELNQKIKALCHQGKDAETLELARRACDLARLELGDNHAETATSFNNLGYLLHKTGDRAGAQSCYEQAVEINRRMRGDHPKTAVSLSNFGHLLQDMGKLSAARQCYEEALNIRRACSGDHDPDTASVLNHLGNLLGKMGDTALGKSYLEQALAIRRRILGENHPITSNTLNNLAVLLHQMKDLTGARTCYQQALENLRREVGEDDPNTATSLNNLGVVLQDAGNYAMARIYIEQALEVRRRVLGNDHPNTAGSLNNLGVLLEQLGDRTGARLHLEQSLEIRRRVLGNDSLETATSFRNLGKILRLMGKLAEARICYEQALEIHHRILGKDHAETAISLNNLGYLLQVMGDLTAARRCYEQALALSHRIFGENHPETVGKLLAVGSVLHDMGKLAEARLCKEQALVICRRVLGNDHPTTAKSLNNLGCLFHDLGDLAQARSCIEQALEIRRRVLGDEHPETANSLKNLGMMLKEMGDLAEARPFLEQALEIHRRVLGNDHTDTANSIHLLGTLLDEMRDLAGAQTCYEQALDIRRRVLGQDHSSTAVSLNNLGLLMNQKRDRVAARTYLERSLDIFCRVLGKDHPLAASSLNNLGMVLQDMRDLVSARHYFQQALEIRRRVLGDDHSDTSVSLGTLGTLEASSGRFAEALTLLRYASRIDDRMIGQIFSVGTDRQRLLFLKTLHWKQERFLSLVSRHLHHSPEAVRSAFDLVLRRKALAADALAAQRDAVLGGRYPQLREGFEQLTEIRRQIARKTLAGLVGDETLADHERTLQQWRQEQQQRETELARQIPEVSLEQRLLQADRRAVALGLDEGVALVEFVRLDVFDFHTMPGRGERRRQSARYLAFVLPGGQPDEVQMIDLGEASPIDRMIADFRDSVAVDPRERPDRDIRRHRGKSRSDLNEQVGAALRAAVFDKLVPALGNRRRVLLAPDGDLTRLPFELLPDAEGRLLLEQYVISYLGCGRDVLRFGAATNRQPSEPLVVADPHFDLTLDDAVAIPATAAPSRYSRDFKRSDYHFPRLPGTREEGERVAELLGVRPWLEGEAMEARLKEKRSPRLLHLATHGFFLTDQERYANKELRDFEMIDAEAGGSGRFFGPLPENPLLRSGLALAGAQTWINGKPLPPEAEDGILTAEDVTGLDLLDTELVVLSACETGLGEVRTGEGVFGLRRAFIVAGARTLVMSLWKVPDEQTRELMIDFYQRVLSGQGVADALRQAQLPMKAKYPDPYYWGAFICQGNPGPLASCMS